VIVKKYLINVNFLKDSRVHLNPNFFGGMWCRLDEIKKTEHEGRVYVTSKKVRNYLNKKKKFYYKGKEVKNLTRCLNCSRRGEQSAYWDI